MGKIRAFLGLVRWVNLSYIALTQVLVFFCLQNFNATPQFSLLHLILLVISTVSLAAAGYIINDYFDVQADEINKPNRIFINRVFKRRTAIIWHVLLNIIGVGLGVYLALLLGNPYLCLVHILVWAMLWYYSVNLKRQPLIGNLVVSLITALVVMVVYWFNPNLPFRTEFIYGYAIFAFLMNMQRELVKDMEDIEGDKSIGCRTLPIVWGVPKTKNLTIIINLLTFTSLVSFQVFQIVQNSLNWQKPSWWLTILFLQIPLLYLILRLKKADRPINFKFISNAIKTLMLVGILLLVILQLEGTI